MGIRSKDGGDDFSNRNAEGGGERTVHEPVADSVVAEGVGEILRRQVMGQEVKAGGEQFLRVFQR